LKLRGALVLTLLPILLLSGCSAEDNALLVYSGRSEALLGPLVEKFEQESGLDVEVRYAGSAELAAQLLEEGENSPADVFLAQDAGALGAAAKAGLLPASPTRFILWFPPATRLRTRAGLEFPAEPGFWSMTQARSASFL